MEIVRTRAFDRDLRRIGVTASDLAILVRTLAQDPRSGDLIVGLGGLRKIRFGIPSRKLGKSSGGRAIYIVLETDDALVLLAAYAKNEKADLSAEDRKALLKIMEQLESPDD